jgi:hypothetical protein
MIESVSGSCPTLTFQVDGRRIVTNAATRFERGSCSSLKEKNDVTVEGLQLANGSVTALVVTRK